MEQLLQLIVNGLAVGSIYGLVALGFVMVYEATGVVNFATGQLVMVGAFVSATGILLLSLPIIPAWLLMLAGMTVVGVIFYVAVYNPLRDRPVLTVIIGTVAIGIAIQNGALLAWGPFPFRPQSPFLDQKLNLAGTIISAHSIFVIAVTALLIGLLYVLLSRTAIGRQMRAVAQDVETARLMGIPTRRLIALAWVIAAMLGGVSGTLVAPMWLADINMGDPMAVKAFAATIIGGFGSVPGAILGGVFVGLAEMLGAAYISSEYKDGFGFIAMILFLLLRPQGIFGEKIQQKG